MLNFFPAHPDVEFGACILEACVGVPVASTGNVFMTIRILKSRGLWGSWVGIFDANCDERLSDEHRRESMITIQPLSPTVHLSLSLRLRSQMWDESEASFQHMGCVSGLCSSHDTVLGIRHEWNSCFLSETLVQPQFFPSV